jgi:hypothetical protein
LALLTFLRKKPLHTAQPIVPSSCVSFGFRFIVALQFFILVGVVRPDSGQPQGLAGSLLERSLLPVSRQVRVIVLPDCSSLRIPHPNLLNVIAQRGGNALPAMNEVLFGTANAVKAIAVKERRTKSTKVNRNMQSATNKRSEHGEKSEPSHHDIKSFVDSMNPRRHKVQGP